MVSFRHFWSKLLQLGRIRWRSWWADGNWQVHAEVDDAEITCGGYQRTGNAHKPRDPGPSCIEETVLTSKIDLIILNNHINGHRFVLFE